MVVQAQANTFPENGGQPGGTRTGRSPSEAWMGVQIPPSTQSHARKRRDTWRNWKQSTAQVITNQFQYFQSKQTDAHTGGGGLQRKNGNWKQHLHNQQFKGQKNKMVVLTGSCGSANGPSVGDNESIVSSAEWLFTADIKGRRLNSYIFALSFV